jgi:hypothetical protein
MDGDGLFDNIGPEEFGMALGLGEEIGLGEQEDWLARKESEAEEDPLSLEEHKQHRQLQASNVRRKPAPRGSYEEWVRLVIDGEIDPYDVDRYPYSALYDDPM